MLLRSTARLSAPFSRYLTSARLPRRHLATMTSPAKHEWIVILPDHENALERRLEVRPTHFAALKPHLESGTVLFGGAMLDDVPREGEQLKMRGSVMLALGESKEEVLGLLRNDVYAKSGVWDMDKVQIYPFKSAFRKAM